MTNIAGGKSVAIVKLPACKMDVLVLRGNAKLVFYFGFGVGHGVSTLHIESYSLVSISVDKYLHFDFGV